MSRHWSYNRDVYSSKTASEITSEAQRVADAESITIFLRGSPSTTTIQGSNADGLNNDITNSTADWSDLSVIIDPSPDMVEIETGFGYIRCLRSETTEVRLQLQF